jgi:SHS2 domain-containing protein
MPPSSRAVARLRGYGLPAGVKLVEHTADTGIQVEGSTLEQCFARAAAGMFACFIEGGGRAGVTLDIDLRADNLEELLVAWLEELLFRSEVSHLVFLTFEVLEVGRGCLHAHVRGRPLRPDEVQTGPVIKAVTRHGLAMVRTGGRWQTRVIFDV